MPEELERAYAELSRTNAELRTTNEEFLRTVEELEAVSEELQSANEELHALTDEVRLGHLAIEGRQREVDRLDSIVAAVLGSMDSGVVVVDADMHVLAWNHRAEDLWGPRAEDVIGEHLMNLDVGLPLEQLRQPIRRQLADPDDPPATVELVAVHRSGRRVRVHVTISATRDHAAGTTSAMVSTRVDIAEDHAER